MAPTSLQHRRTHNLLLISKLLNQRDAASPFTLVLDSLEQPGKPLIAEYLKRAKASKLRIVLVSFETLKQPNHVDSFITAWNRSLQQWRKELVASLKSDTTSRTLLIFDALNALSATESSSLPALLSSFISPTCSLLALYHTDIPGSISRFDSYCPAPLTLLKYLATTIYTVHSLHHVLSRKRARERSHAEPSFGLDERVEGVVQGLGANGSTGLVFEIEHRRKSGRGVKEWYFMPYWASSESGTGMATSKTREAVSLLEDHPLYRTSPDSSAAAGAGDDSESTTFELELTDRQRQDREGVVLPYFDAQKGEGEGGRILYDMGSEDDFDEEEDEI